MKELLQEDHTYGVWGGDGEAGWIKIHLRKMMEQVRENRMFTPTMMSQTAICLETFDKEHPKFLEICQDEANTIPASGERGEF